MTRQPDIIFHTFVEKCPLHRALLGCARFSVTCVTFKMRATHVPLAIDIKALPAYTQYCVTCPLLQPTIFSIYGAEFRLEITECAEHIPQAGVVSYIFLCFTKTWKICQHATSFSESFIIVCCGCFPNSDSCVFLTVLKPDSPFQAFTYEMKNMVHA
jgi:hypothetical protein